MAYDVRMATTVKISDSVTSEQYVSKVSDLTAPSANRTKYVAQGYTVPAATVDQAINIDNMTTINDVLLVTDQPIFVKVNSTTATAIAFSTKFLIQGGSVTNLYISNNLLGASTANLYLVAAGV